MPELPEVETIKNELSPHVIGRKITGVDVFWDKMVRQPKIPEFRERVTGRKITALTRRGKYLFFHLDNGEKLVMHMKMTGSLLLDPSEDKFSRAIFKLDDGKMLHFRDPRKFGVMWLASDESSVMNKLGPEPLDGDFTTKTLAEILHRHKSPVKAVLLDQSVIAGIGNMYADEALYEAKIHPERPADSLADKEVTKLYRAIRHVLRAAIKNKGASMRNYYRPDGNTGHAHDEFRVAHGTGTTCPRCGTPIMRIVVRGRGTYLCPRCQPPEP
jgi:formamidopyrimidine-DNA glycosylase